MARDEGFLSESGMKVKTQKLCQAASCLLCVVMWRYGLRLDGTEFSGGWLTGPLVNLYDVGTLLLVPAFLLTFFFRQVAAAIVLIGSVSCLPLYLYFTAPGPFRHVFSKAVFSVPLQGNFVWNGWAALGILTIVLAICISVWNLATTAAGSKPSPGSPDHPTIGGHS